MEKINEVFVDLIIRYTRQFVEYTVTTIYSNICTKV